MKLGHVFAASVFCITAAAALAQQPPGAREALSGLSSQPSTHTSFTFDKDMLSAVDGVLSSNNEWTGDARHAVAALNSVTVETFHFHEPAFYIPENMSALVHAYDRAGWKHLVNQNASPRDAASPRKPMTDMWLHFRGAEIDDVAILVRAPKDMNLIEVSGALRPLDLVHLSGHFGIPKVDPDAVMVPAPPGK